MLLDRAGDGGKDVISVGSDKPNCPHDDGEDDG